MLSLQWRAGPGAHSRQRCRPWTGATFGRLAQPSRVKLMHSELLAGGGADLSVLEGWDEAASSRTSWEMIHDPHGPARPRTSTPITPIGAAAYLASLGRAANQSHRMIDTLCDWLAVE